MTIGETSLSALVGAIGWEIIRQLISYQFSKKTAKQANLRKKIESLKDDIFGILENSFHYYMLPSTTPEAAKIARDIRVALKICGSKIGDLNLLLEQSNYPKVGVDWWTSFKKSTTGDLDVLREKALPDDDPRLNAMHRSANDFQKHLSALWDSA